MARKSLNGSEGDGPMDSQPGLQSGSSANGNASGSSSSTASSTSTQQAGSGAGGAKASVPRNRIKTVTAKSSIRGPKRFKISTPRLVLTAVAGIVLLAATLYAFNTTESFLIRDPRFTVQGIAGVTVGESGDSQRSSVLITGAKHASLRAIEGIFTPDLGRSTYLIPLAQRMMALRTVDWVRDASVARIWPDRLVVKVTEREPVAFLPLPSSSAGMIDAEGVILPPTAGNFVLPALIGPKPSDEPEYRRAAVARFLAISAALGDDMKNISDVDVSDPDNVIVSQAYEGKLLKLKLGDRHFAKRYRGFVQSYPEIREKAPDSRVMDLRVETRIIAE
ncbi:MAG: FtsQ-type POTRA domain-containing protein [Acidobacteriota bacterium]